MRAVREGDTEAQRAARTALEHLNIDIELQQRLIERMENELAARLELTAPFDGVVTEVHAEEGMKSPAGLPEFRLYGTDKGMEFEVRVPANIADTLSVGDLLEVRTTGKEARTVEGTVESVDEVDELVEPGELADTNPTDSATSDSGTGTEAALAEEIRLLRIVVRDEALRGGERVRLELAAGEEGDALLVSSRALRWDRDGAYAFVIRERTGPLGNAYYAERANVELSGADDRTAAVVSGLSEFDRIVVESEEPLEDGTRVRL